MVTMRVVQRCRCVVVALGLVCMGALAYADCAETWLQAPNYPNELAEDISEYALAFAAKHNLPVRRVPVGDPKLGRSRWMIGVTINTPAFADYLDSFNEGASYKSVKGMAVVEAQYEYRGGVYVFEWVRRLDGAKRNKQNMSVEQALNSATAYIVQDLQTAPVKIIALSHPIPLTAEMSANYEVYWRQPGLRAPLKKNNCIDFIPCLELGRTAAGVPDVERKFISHHLGFSRSYSYDEIASRFAHAANENHQVMFAFLQDDASLETFKTQDPARLLPPHPKIPYNQIVANYNAAVEQYEADLAAAVQPRVQTVQQVAEPVVVAPPPVPPLTLAIREIHDGAKIFFPIAAGASSEAFHEIVQQAPRFEQGVDVYLTVSGISENLLRQAAATGKIRLHSLFVGQSMRAPVRDGIMHQQPLYLSDISAYMLDARRQDLKFDVVIVRVSPPDKDGRYSLGSTMDHVGTLLSMRSNGHPLKIIAEVNQNMPFTYGTDLHYLTQQDFTATFNSDLRLAGPAIVPITDVEGRIGQNIASIIEDGNILQIGIGNLFDALPAALADLGRANLGIRTEMFGDASMHIMKLGLASYAFTSFAYGSDDLYQWLNNNPDVQFGDSNFINGIKWLEQLKGFVAVNTALQVDLFGEVNATFGPEGRISSAGGQVEFMMGAHRSPGGKSIIAIRSTAKNETISTITPVGQLYGPVTTPGEMVSHVVTEYGVADFTGENDVGRAIKLINIAHPKFRRNLFDEAVRRKLLEPEDQQAINF